MKSSSRSAVAVTLTAYFFALMTMSTIGVIVPFVVPIAASLHCGGAAVGFGIALFSLPAALLATLGGSLIDRVGIKRALIAACVVTMLGDLVMRGAGSIWMLDAGLLINGFGLASIAVGAPALLIGALHDTVRTRAMAFLATFAPTGFALGLLMAIPFTSDATWRSALGAHLVLALIVGLLGVFLLPSVARAPASAPAGPRGGLSILFRYRPALRLGLAIALPNGIAYGTSLVAPSYLARADGISLAYSAGAVAAAKIVALILGGLVTGQILAGHKHPWHVFAAMVATGIVAQVLFFSPSGSFALSVAALVLWLFAFGGMSGVAMSLLPRVIPGPGREAATTGLVNQLVGVLSFAAPSVYFAMSGWGGFIGLAVIGLLLSLAILPVLRLNA